MKRIRIFLYALVVLTSVSGLCPADEAVIPKGFTPDRYEPLWKKSPFTLSSVAEALPGGFAEQLMLAGILKIGGNNHVSIFNKETKTRFFVSAVPGKDGIQVEKVESGGDLKDVVVTLKKGNEVATLRYDEEFMKQSQSVVASPQPAVAAPVRANINQPPRSNRTAPVRRIIIPRAPTPQK